jgi:hypothetical protein
LQSSTATSALSKEELRRYSSKRALEKNAGKKKAIYQKEHL